MFGKSLAIGEISNILVKFLPLISFIVPLIILYFLDPMVFEKTWKGRIFYVFFLWLFSLEVILGWEEIGTNKIKRFRSVRTIAFILALMLPTIYVAIANFCGLNGLITDLASKNNMEDFFADMMPLSTEYLVFTGLLALIIMLQHGIDGLKSHAISTAFLGTIGMIYTIDNVYPQGRFTPFQIIVPTTATLAANLLSFMGYRITWYATVGGMPTLGVTSPQGGTFQARIAWPCSGVESLLIYSVTILLFLKNSTISWKKRIVYFAFGAAVTYFINILRIVTIFIIGINDPNAVWTFHDYYGPLYSISWITLYPLLIIGGRALWGKIRAHLTITEELMLTR